MSANDYGDWVRGDGTSPVIAGNYRDDDAQYVDDLVTSTGDVVIPPRTIFVQATAAKPMRYARLLTGHQVWNTGAGVETDPNQITQILPADENRKHLQMMVTSGSSAAASITAAILFADSRDKLAYVGQLDTGAAVGTLQGAFLPLGIPITIDDYTGELWVRPLPVAATVRLSYVAVTA